MSLNSESLLPSTTQRAIKPFTLQLLRHKNNEQAYAISHTLYNSNSSSSLLSLSLSLSIAREYKQSSVGRLILKCHTNQRDSCKFRLASARVGSIAMFQSSVAILFQATSASFPPAPVKRRAGIYMYK